MTGRGLVALVAKGGVYVLELEKGEDVVLHPTHVLAYSAGRQLPLPYRLPSKFSGFQVPTLGLPLLFNPLSEAVRGSNFIRAMADTDTWRGISRAWWRMRTWLRASIWGDRLMMRFEGPGMILMQSRGERVRDVLGRKEIDEIASADSGSFIPAMKKVQQGMDLGKDDPVDGRQGSQTSQHITKEATVKIGEDGKAKFE